MNTFLRAIGFSKYTTKKSMHDIIAAASLYPETMDYISSEDEGKIYEFKHIYGNGFGIKFYGTESDDLDYDIDSYVPFVLGTHFFSPSDLCVEKRYRDFSFIASCEDLRIGVSIIFHLLNPVEYVNFLYRDIEGSPNYSLAFSALSCSGTILLPVTSSPGDKEKKQLRVTKRASLIAAARNGDENAIESLTFEDMDTYAKLSKRILREDVFTIVESSFMPYGLESDLYTIVADIVQVIPSNNTITGELVYNLTLDYYGVLIDTVINALDLTGEPTPGRRFKGTIWLQGTIRFEN